MAKNENSPINKEAEEAARVAERRSDVANSGKSNASPEEIAKANEETAANEKAAVDAADERFNTLAAATATPLAKAPDAPEGAKKPEPEKEIEMPPLARVTKTSYVNDVLVEVEPGSEGTIVGWPKGVDPRTCGENLVPTDTNGKKIEY